VSVKEQIFIFVGNIGNLHQLTKVRQQLSTYFNSKY